MARLVACLLLVVIVPAALAQDLAGHKALIRRYNRLDTNPGSYEGFLVDIKPDGLGIEPGQIGDMGALVLTAGDQKDPDVAALLQGGVFSAAYRDGQIDTGSGFKPLAQHRPTLADFGVDGETMIVRKTMLDALGKPIVGAAAEMKLQHEQYDPGPALPTLPSDAEGGIEYFSARGYYRYVQLIVKHEKYGSAPFVDLDDGRLALVADNDPAASRALSGRVVDASGKPAAGAMVTVNYLHQPSQGAVPVRSSCAAHADAAGHFRIYPILKNKRAEDAELIPPGMMFDVVLTNPADRSQPPITLRQLNNNCGDLVLAAAGKLRRFEFVGADGKPLDADRLKDVAISSPGPAWAYHYKDATEGRRFLPGKYEAELPFERLKFDPVMIDDKTPEVVVFRLSASIHYEGRVIDATTSRPLAGALVYAITQQVTEPWQALTREQWDAIHRLPREPKMDDPALEHVRRVALVRTDTDGRYSLPAPAGTNMHSVGAVEQNYLCMNQPVLRLNPDASGKIVVDDFVLYPAGCVSFTITAPNNANVLMMPKWEIDRASLDPKYTDVFFSPRVGNRVIYPYNDWFHTGANVTIPVPANVSFGLFFHPNSQNTQYAPLHVSGPLRVAPGQRLDLGTLKLAASVLATIQVVGPDDSPLEGVSVRNVYVVDGQMGAYASCMTDAQGLAFLDIAPGMKGAFSIGVGSRNNQGLKIRLPYDCPEGAAELPIQKVKLTPEQFAAFREVRDNTSTPQGK